MLSISIALSKLGGFVAIGICNPSMAMRKKRKVGNRRTLQHGGRMRASIAKACSQPWRR